MLKSSEFRVIPFIGYSKSGKTQSIETLIDYFTQKNFFVIALKHTGKEDFTIDSKGKNTWRYSQAGANIVSTHCLRESSIIMNLNLSSHELLSFVEHILKWPNLHHNDTPIVILCEGFRDLNRNHVLCAHSKEEVKSQLNNHTIAISGRISESQEAIDYLQNMYNLPVINTLKKPEQIHSLFENPNSC